VFDETDEVTNPQHASACLDVSCPTVQPPTYSVYRAIESGKIVLMQTVGRNGFLQPTIVPTAYGKEALPPYVAKS